MLRKTTPWRRALATTAVGGLTALALTGTPAAAVTGDGSAADTYGWGAPGWSDEFTGAALAPDWGVYSGPGNGGNGQRSRAQVRVADGVMTQTGTADAITAGMVMTDHLARYGRWEARLRTPSAGQGGRAYHPVTALIPGGGAPYHCGATDVDFAEGDIGAPEYVFAHNLPNLQDYTSVRLDMAQWHDFAVELTPGHLSWFVDGRVVMTDATSAIVSNVPYAVNFQLDANVPGGLDPATLQVDWVRYYPVSGDPAPVPAPEPQHGSYTGAC